MKEEARASKRAVPKLELRDQRKVPFTMDSRVRGNDIRVTNGGLMGKHT